MMPSRAGTVVQAVFNAMVWPDAAHGIHPAQEIDLDTMTFWDVRDLFTLDLIKSPSAMEIHDYLEGRRQRAGVHPVFHPPLSEEMQKQEIKRLASKLFNITTLNNPEIKDLLCRVLGDVFLTWVKNSIRQEEVEKRATTLCLTKLRELQERYPNLELIDMIVIYSYSWYADKYMREELKKRNWEDFGQWKQFAAQFTESLRKLKRFTGTELYRCSRHGEEEQRLKLQGNWVAHSFLSTTYTEEARKSLEEDPKYRWGKTLIMDARQVEGYHNEEFSLFYKEHEVVLLPGHELVLGQEEGRNIQSRLNPPTNARRFTGTEPDSLSYFKKLHAEQNNIPPPPPKKFG